MKTHGILFLYLAVLLKVRSAAHKTWRESLNIHFMFNSSPPPENRAVYEAMWKNMVESYRLRMTM